MEHIYKTTNIEISKNFQATVERLTRKDRLRAKGIPANAAEDIIKLCKELNDGEFNEVLTKAVVATEQINKQLTPAVSPELTSAEMTMQILKDRYAR